MISNSQKRSLPRISLTLALFFLLNNLYALQFEPSYWWVGMKSKSLQILVHEENIAVYSQGKTNNSGVKIISVSKGDSPNYLFLDLEIAESTKPGMVNIELLGTNTQPKTISYELKQRTKERPLPITQNDIVYLIMPDRFANADESNDYIKELVDTVNRKKPFARHGGDLKGIKSKLDYIQDLGITALWLNPVIENANKNGSYHGYGFTNFYKIDPRFGNHADYADLIQEAHKKGIKSIKDMVLNHIGISHPWLTDPPLKNWIHYYEEKPKLSNFRLSTLVDPHASAEDKLKMENGWFVPNLPDLNQANPLLSKYLIQNTLWWIESAKLDGIRLDTYPYSDKNFLTEWHKAIEKEYPNFYIVGEIWINNIPSVSYWLKGTLNQDGFKGGLVSATDFPLNDAIGKSIGERGSWDGGFSRVYEVLSQDFQYKKPENNLIFLDNHDVARFLHLAGNDIRKLKLSLTLLLTTRGIPQLYYGTELLMNGDGDHGKIRYDFPGGWKNDSINAFSPNYRTNDQNEVYNHIKTLNNIRKNSDAIGNGQLVHFIPEENVYVYFRQSGKETLMVILNGNKDAKEIKTSRFAQFLEGKKELKSLLSDLNYSEIPVQLKLEAFQSQIFKVY